MPWLPWFEVEQCGTCDSLNIRWHNRFTPRWLQKQSDSCDFRPPIPRLVVLFYFIGFGILKPFLMNHVLQAHRPDSSTMFNPALVAVEFFHGFRSPKCPLPLPFRWLNSFQWKCALQGWVSATMCLGAYLKHIFLWCFPAKRMTDYRL